MGKLQGKVAVVTGGTTGIGFAGDRLLMLNRDRPRRAHRVFVSNRRTHQSTDSESISILVAQVVTAT